MATIRKLKRRRKGAKRFDPTDLKALLADTRCWACAALVVVPDGLSSHYEMVTEDGKLVDIMVEVETVPDQQDLTCRLASVSGGTNAGIWTIPPVGAEVIVLIPNAQIDFMPTIVAILPTGEIPDDVAPGVTVIANSSKVIIHDGNGGAEPLITKSQFDAHKHPSGTGPTGPPDNAATSGTTVLEAK